MTVSAKASDQGETPDRMASFFTSGWARFPHDPDIARWVDAARPVGEALAAHPDTGPQWLRCGGTWYAGVNVFPNAADGAVPDRDVPPLRGAVIQAIDRHLGLTDFAWDNAQISICYPGYPQPWDGETDAAFRFRKNRDAAHVDGLLRDADRRRFPGERHGFILGLPLTDAAPDAAPFVVYEGSHHIIRAALTDRLAGVAPEDWAGEDVTDVYTAARKHCFQTCRRVALHARPGEATLVHRLALHGVAPWGDQAGATPRAIAYFRPDPFPGGNPDWWLAQP